MNKFTLFKNSVLFYFLLAFSNLSLAQVPTFGLVAHYPFSGNAADSSGYGNNGIVYNGATLTADRFGYLNKSYNLNGASNAYITIPTASQINTANFNNCLLSVWIRPMGNISTNVDRRVLNIQSSNGTNYEIIYNYSTGKFRFLNNNGSIPAVNILISSRETAISGMWYHVAIRIDSTNRTQMFINGALDTFSTIPIVKPVNPIITIGNNPLFSWNFQGDLDAVRLYNKYLGTNDVVALYNEGIQNGLVAYYPFNGNVGDSSGCNNHGTAYGPTLTSDKNGTPNSAYYFNGINSYISAPATFSLHPPNTLTITAWISPENKISGSSNVISKRYDYSVDPYETYSVSTSAGSPNFNKWAFNASKGTNGTLKSVLLRNLFPSNTWLFLAATYDSTSLKIYINGVLDSTIIFRGNLGYSNLPLLMGYNGAGVNDYYKGKIDDVKIFNRALSASEIRSMYPAFENNYYSKSNGPLDSLSTWGTNTDGSGATPLNFNTDNTAFYVINNPAPSIGSNWFITGSNTAVIFGEGTSSSNVTIPSGLNLGADSVVVRNNITFTAIGNVLSNKYYFENGSTMQYISSNAQNLPATSFYNLIVAGSTKNLIGNTQVRNNLTMLSSINCGSNQLTLGSSASQPGILNRNAGTIIGSFTRWFANTTNSGNSSALFPIGSVSIYRPLLIEYSSAPSVGGTLSAQFISSTPGNAGLPLYDFSTNPLVTVTKMGINGYWKVDAGNGISGGAYTCTATGTGFFGINAVSDLRMLRRTNNASAWTLPGASVLGTGTVASPVVSRTGITINGGEFGIGSDSLINPLPVKLINFDAKRNSSDDIELAWQTAFELNNSHFELERTFTNPETNYDWETIARIKGKGNSNNLSSYKYIDNGVQSSNARELFYRLKQVDFDGNSEYSKTVSVGLIKSENEISVYPNPFSNQITINKKFETNESVKVELFDLLGRKLLNKNIGQYDNKLNLNEITQEGMYILKVGNSLFIIGKQ